jgi:xanthine dehydrogenase accessory factor
VNPDIQARAAELRHDHVPFVHARVVLAERPTSAKPGDEAVILPDGTIEGFVGGACAESTVRAQCLSLLDSGESLLLRISPDGGPGGADRAPGDAGPGGDAKGAGRSPPPPGTLTVVNPCLSGGTLEIFLEPVIPAPAIAVVGESPIAAALVALAERVGFRVVDGAGGSAPSPEWLSQGLAAVVVASHGRDEERSLAPAVRAGVPYVGLVASRKRGEAVVAALDLDESERASVHTPAGLDIGARTPREVALSILAEIVSLRPRPSGVPRPAAGSARTSSDSAAIEGGDHAHVAIDLVCGMAVVADDAALHLDHGGTRYWFCGTGCLRAFAADPSAYVPPGV